VLFASKNNKAVDVVETRVNTLGPRPILLRLGTDKVRAELAEYLLYLLASVTTAEDAARYQEYQQSHKELLNEIAIVEKLSSDLISLRNQVDGLERNVEPLRNELSREMFAICRDIRCDECERATKQLSIALDHADRNRQSWFVKISWRAFEKKRLEDLQIEANKCRAIFEMLNAKLPSIDALSDESIGKWRTQVNNASRFIKAAREIQKYTYALDRLNNMESLPRLHARILALTERSMDICHKLWECWLSLQPAKLTPQDRRLIGDYASILQLIVNANAAGNMLGKEVFSKYYNLFPKITNLLPCWAVTSLSANGRIPLEAGFFDLVVIDEASQCDIASALPLLFRAKSAVIIGDPKQLKHISSLSLNKDRELLGKHGIMEHYAGWAYSVTSLFDLASSLCVGGQITVLRDHHRSHHDIIEFSNRTFYEGKLVLPAFVWVRTEKQLREEGL